MAKTAVPFLAIVALYHEILPELPKVLKLGAWRKTQLSNRWKEDLDSLDAWRMYFTSVRDRRFLMGKVKDWTADFDFLVQERKMEKIIAGGYRGQAQ